MTTNENSIRKEKFLLGHCRELLAVVLSLPGAPADAVMSKYIGERRYLGSHDRAMIADTVYAILRQIIRYRFVLAELIDGRRDIDREAAVYVAAHQIENETGVADTALRDSTTLRNAELVRMRSLIPAGPDRIAELGEIEQKAITYGLPLWFTERVVREIGDLESDLLFSSLMEQGTVTLRANTLQTTREKLVDVFHHHNIAARPGEYSENAVILEKRINARSLDVFKNGWFEMQDEGSQILSQILDPHPNWRVFDACAGAGGKTLHMAAIMKGRGEIIAHDLNAKRLKEIRPRMRRSGAQNIRVVDNEEYRSREDEFIGEFHAVLIDAPCTGVGVLRRNPGARLTLDSRTLGRLVDQQLTILDDYSRLVRPGGLMLYATCSLLKAENEEQVRKFLDRRADWRVERVNAPEGMSTADGYYRSYPHRHGTDAFFGALLRRVG